MSTYSPSLRVELITSGDQAGQWGNTTNDNFSYIFDAAIAGYQTVSVTSASQAFTYNNGPVSTASLNQSVYAMLRLTTTTAAAFSVYAPPNSKQYIIWNNSGYAATIYNSTVIGNTTAAGTGVTIADGDRVLVWSNGTNFYEIKTSGITGTLAIANGGTGQTTQQAAINALAGAVTSGSYLRGNGTNVGMSTIQAADLPTATDSANGAIKLGSGTAQSVAANAVTATASRTYALQLNASGQGVVNVPWTDTSSTSPGGSTTQVQYNNAGTFGGSANFVFDGTNVGIGETTPATYGKFVVGGTGSFTSSFVSTSSTLSDKPTLEFRKTANIASTANNAIGRVSFYSQQGSTTAETSYINARDNRTAGISIPELKLAVYSTVVGAEPCSIVLSNNLSLSSNNSISYSAATHAFAGDVNFVDAVTVSSVPVVTTTGSQTLSNKTFVAPALGTPASGNLANCTFPTLNQNTTGTAAGLSSTLAVSSGGTGLTSYTSNGVLYASGTSTLANGSNFVFDGTNVGIGESSPSTYGKFVVGGTGSFTSALVSTSSTTTDRPLLEIRKTRNNTSGQVNTVGAISFNGKWGSTAGEQGFINLVSTNVSGLLDSNVLTLGVKSIFGGGTIEGNIQIGVSSVYIDSGNGGEISIVNSIIYLNGDVQSPTLTGTPTTPTAAAGTNTTQVASTAFVQTAVRALYPVGSIYINATNATNPGTLLGFGTWVAFGAGRVPVGFDAGNALFDAAEETGGSADAITVSHTHTATVTDPAHRHQTGNNAETGVNDLYGNDGEQTGSFRIANTGGDGYNAWTNTATTGVTVAISTTGSSGTNANYQPYITVYMWKRTA